MGCRGFWSFSLGFRPAFLYPWPYFRVCVSVAVFLSTATSRYHVSLGFWAAPHYFQLKCLRCPVPRNTFQRGQTLTWQCLRRFLICFLDPSPGGPRGRVWTVSFPRKSVVLGRSLPGSGRYFMFDFHFGTKRSWVKVSRRFRRALSDLRIGGAGRNKFFSRGPYC